MAKVTKFKDRQNNILLPVTRATLVEMNNGDSVQMAYEGINLTHYTKDEINAAGYLTSHQDLSSYVTKEYLSGESYVTSTYLDSRLFNVDVVSYITEYDSSYAVVVGDTHDEAFSKLIKIIDDNEYVTAQAITFIHEEMNSYVSHEQLNAAGYLTSHQDLSAYATNESLSTLGNTIDYDSNSKRIYLKHNNTELAYVDATDFIKDGMVDTAYVNGSYLTISFNTDAGKQPIDIPLEDIFDPTNYYDKTTVDEKVDALMQNEKLSFYTTAACSVDIYTKDDSLNGDYSGETPINTFNYSANTLVQLNVGEDEHFEINNPNDGIKVIYSWAGICEKFYDWFMSVNMFCNMVFNFNKMDHTAWEHTTTDGSQYKYGVVEAQYKNCVFWWDVACTNASVHCYMLHKTIECPIFYSTNPANTYKTLVEPYNLIINPNFTNPDFLDSFASATGRNAFCYAHAKDFPFGTSMDPNVKTNIITLPAECRTLMSWADCEGTATFDCTNVTNFGYGQSGTYVYWNAFYMCYNMRNLMLKNLKISVDLSWSPISQYSLNYIISNAANSSAINIKLSPYTWYNLTDAIKTAATNKSITLLLGAVSNNSDLKIWDDARHFLSQSDLTYYVTTDALSGMGYLTSHQDLTSYVSKSELDEMGYLTSFTETDPTVPSYVKSITQQNITDWGNKLDSSALNNYYTKSDINSAGYLQSSALNNYYTKSDINSAGYLTSAALSNYVEWTTESANNYISFPDPKTLIGQVDGEFAVTDFGFITKYKFPFGKNGDVAVTSDIDNALSAAGYLTSHQDLSSYATSANYDTSAKKIYLKHGSTVLSEIDATNFIKDGMVDTAYVQNGNLIISFNTDAGKSPVSIPVTDIFNANNYYTKTEINSAGYLQSETDPIYSASAAAGITSAMITNWNSYTANTGTITGITMNNTSKGTSGVVDLGTVITSETQLSKGTATGSGNAVTDISVSNHQITLTKGKTFIETETDPVYSASAAAGITSSDITNWNNKTSNTGTITGITMNNTSKGTSGVVDLGTVITSETQLSKGSTSGSGNAVTDISVSNHQITLTKGKTFIETETDPVYSASAAAGITSGMIINWNSYANVKANWNETNSNSAAYIQNKPTIPTGLPSVTSSDNGKILQVVNGAWTLVSPVTLYSGSGTPNNAQGNNGDIYLQI